MLASHWADISLPLRSTESYHFCCVICPPRTFTKVHTGVCGLLLTDAIFLVPVELLSGWTHTLVAALRVYAAVLTAAVVDAALIDV